MRTLATSLRLALVPLTMLAPFHGFGLSSASAQDVPARTHFQGRLTDASNNPLTGPNSFVFEIFDAPAAGALQWTEAQPAVPVANGVFAVQLGAVTPLPSTVFSGSTAYLQVTVNGNVMTPRERLVSVPFSHNTQLLSGRAFAAFVSTDAATQNIAGAKTFTGTVFVPAPTAPGHAASKAYVDSAGGTVLLSSTNTWSGQNSFLNLVSVSSDLVITGVLNRGTPLSLGGPLSVAAGVTAASGTFTASGPAQFSLQTSSGISVGGAGGVYANFFSGSFYGDGAGLTGLSGVDSTKVLKAGDTMTGQLTNTSTVTVLGNAFSVGGSTLAVTGGKVGIGTAGPTEALHIRGNAPSLKLEHTGGADVTLHTSDGSGLAGIHITEGTNKLSIQDAGDTIMARASGSVGIRTVDPAQALDVNGNAQFGAGAAKSTFTAAGALSLASGAALTLAGPAGNFTGASSVTASGFFGDGSGLTNLSASDASRVAKAGDTMTGQLTNTSTVTVQGNAFSVGGSTLVVSGGKVGLGTTTPASALHVKADGASLRQEGDKPVFLSHNSSAFSTPNRRKIHIGWADDSRFAVEQRTDSEAGLTFRYLSFDLNNGNTGVGTSAVAPLATLHAEGNTPFIASSAGVELIRVTGSSVAFAGGAVVMRSTAATAGHAFLRLEDNAGIELLRAQQNGRIGLGTTAPGTKLDVEGNAQFGSGATKSTFTTVGALTLAYDAALTLSGASGDITTNSSMTASAFFGSGAGLTGVSGSDATKVAKSGDAMTGPLTVSGSSITIVDTNVSGAGDAFSLAVTTAPDRSVYHLVVSTTGNVGIGTANPGQRLEVKGSAATDGGLRVATDAASTNAGSQVLQFGTYVSGAYTPTAIIGDTSGADSALKIFALQGNMHLGSNTGGAATTRMVVNTSGGVTVGGSDLASTGSRLYVEGPSAVVVDNSGSVGVGTTSPGAKLDVEGAAQFGSGAAKSTFTAAGGLTFASGFVPAAAQDAATKGYVDGQATAASGWTQGGGLVRVTNPSNSVVVQSTLTVQGNAFSVGGSTLVVTGGNVGIGTSSPGRQLSLFANAGVPTLRVQGAGGSGGNNAVEFFDSNASKFNWLVGSQWSVDGGFEITPSAAAGGTTYSTPALVLKANGNVGIGTTAPDGRLQLSGTTGAPATLLWERSDGGAGFQNWAQYINLQHGLAFARADDSGGGLDPKLVIDADGKIGIGTTGPSAKLHVSTTGVSGATDVIKVTTATAAGSDVFVIKGDGNVGIGTTSPSERLEVNGALKIAGIKLLQDSGDANRLFFQPAAPNQSLNISVAPNGASGTPGLELFKTDGNADRVNIESLRLLANQSTNRYEIRTAALGTGSLRDLAFLQGAAEIMTLATTGNLGIGTSAPAYKLDVTGDAVVRSSLTYAGALTGDPAATAGQGAMYYNTSTNKLRVLQNAAWSDLGTGGAGGGWTKTGAIVALTNATDNAVVQSTLTVLGNAFSVGVSTFVVKEGNVGIGTTGPSNRLEVVPANGALDFSQGIRVNTNNNPADFTVGRGGGLIMQNADVVTAGMFGIREINSWNGALTFYTHNGSAGNTFGTTFLERMRIDSSGNVGVGTTSPGNARLAVRGAVDFTNQYPQLQVGDSATTMNINMGTGNDGGAKYGFIQSTESGVSNDRTLVLQKYGGNVGIGTTNPGYKLDVNGYAHIGGANQLAVDVAGTGLGYFGNFQVPGGYEFGISSPAYRFVSFNLNTGNSYFNNGSVGVGTTAPTSKLEVAGDIRTSGGGDLILNPAVSGATMYLYNDFGELNVTSGTASQMLFTVKSDGNVGIGTATPAQKLDVRGGLMAYGVSVSTANESRNALWLAMPNDFNHALYNDFSNIDGEGGWDGTKWNVFNGLNVRVGTSKTSALYIGSSGGVGIGTTAPANRLDVAGGGMILRSSMTLTGVAAPAASAAGQGALYFDSAQNKFLVSENGGAYQPLGNAGTYVAKAGDAMTGPLTLLSGSTITISGNAFSVGSSTFVVTSGKVGVGTTSPNAPLHVHQASGQGLVRVSGAASASVFLQDDAVGGATYQLDSGAQQAGMFSITHSGVARRLVIDSSGKVGVGTTSPVGVLTVSSNSVSNVEMLRLENPDVNGAGSKINFTQSGSQTGYVKNAYSAADATWKMHLGAGNSSDLVTIQTNGNVGVGTTNPTERLQFADVASGSDIRIARKAAAAHAAGNVPSSLRLSINDGGEAGMFVMNQRNLANTFNDQYIRFDTHEGGVSVGERVRIAPNGNVGIGTTSPGAKLDVAGHQIFSVPGASITFNAGGPTIGVPAGNTLAFGTSGIERMRLDNLGNLGIGTTGPGHQLQFGTHFNGTVANAKMFVNSGAYNAWNGKIAISPDGNAAVASVISSYHDNTLNIQKLGLGTIGYSGVEQTMVLQDGKVGIRTETPANPLQVSLPAGAGTPYVAVNQTGDNPYLELQRWTGSGSNYEGVRIKDIVGSGGILAFETVQNGGAAIGAQTFTERMRIQGDNVGIGTTGPDARLHVVKGPVAAASSFPAGNWAAKVYNGVDAAAEGGLVVANRWAAAASTAALIGGLYDGGDGFDTFFKVDGVGNVGVGVNNPTEKLHVQGNGKVGDTAATGTVYLQLLGHHDIAGGSGFRLQFDRTNEIFGISREWSGFQTPSLVVKRSDGNVGIGTTNPGVKLAVLDATSPSIHLRRDATNEWYLTGTPAGSDRLGIRAGGNADANEKVSILTGGNVGIGTTAPGSKLDVSGNINASGAVYWGGGSGQRTESKDDAGTIASRSGFFQTSVPVNYYSGASSWQHLIEARHTNDSNNYALQIAGSFFDQDLYFRKTNNSATTAWNKLVYQNSAGNAGIGVATPGARLEVAGQAGTPARNMILSNSSAEDATTRFIDFIRSGVDSEFIVYNNGDVRADGTFAAPADYAELFFSDDATLKPGELVCLAGAAKVKRCGDGGVLIGVVSTKPGVLGVYADDITVAAEERDADPHWVKVGLMGQIPTKFSSKNGGVKSGDQLAVGAAGAAVKGDSPRTLLLIALEDAASDGTVRALVK